MKLKFKVLQLLFSFFIFTSCDAQDSTVEIYDPKTKFETYLPKGFHKMDENSTNRALELGKKTLEDRTNLIIEIENLKPNLFQKDVNNYFTINVREYDEKIDGNYNEAVIEYNKTIKETFRQAFENAEITDKTSKIKIDNVEFTKYFLSVIIPNKVDMKVINYATFKNKNDLAISVIYLDNEVGEEIINSIETAKFKK
ncbi:hypothetical protein [Soonwooa purpurea]